MSWQAYVDSNIMGTNKFAAAVIIGHDGNTWAVSKNFSITKDEGATLVKAFGKPDVILQNGLKLAGQKYLPVRYDDRSIYAKKGASGACCVKTKQAVLIGIYAEGAQAGDCNTVVEKLADYLIGAGY